MKNILKKAMVIAACGSAALAVSNPASAALYTYQQTNGDILTIDDTALSGSLKGSNIDVTFTSAAFAGFTGGASPTGSFNLDSLDGTRTVGGTAYSDNPSHQQVLKFLPNSNGDTKAHLWSWWGNPIVAGDYITTVGTYTPPSTSSGGTPVPAPGMLGLLSLALIGLGFAGRRRKTVIKGNKLALA